MNITKIVTHAITLAFVFSAHAGLETFFGESVSPYQGDINQVPRPTNLISVLQARADFYGRLTGVVTETFESFANGSVPTTLHFGTNTASLAGAYNILEVADATTTFNGVFPSSGTNFLFLTSPAGSTSFTLTFSSPQSAFGFFGTDVEVNQLTITLISTNGHRRSLRPPITVPQGTAGAFFFGVIDQTQPFVAVEFLNAGTVNDGFGFDDMTIAVPQQVLPPRLNIRVSQVELCWDTASNDVYQLQYRSTLTTNAWLPFGSAIVGNGSRFYTNDTLLLGQPQKFYRLQITNAPPEF